jgi:D-alanine-D-alanine ligase
MKQTVAVVMGGPSAEYDVSINSGLEVLRHIRYDERIVRCVVISTKGALFYADSTPDTLPSEADLSSPEASARLQGPFALRNPQQVWENCDVVFLATHGSFGEDGIIQGYLESIGIPHTGSDVYSSAVAMNKVTSKFLYLQHGLSVPPYLLYGHQYPDNTLDVVTDKTGFPCFVKCPQSGSSKLMGRAANREELVTLIDDFIGSSPQLLIEQMVTGPEFTCGVLEDSSGTLTALPPIEIRPKAIFFDYTAKYSEGASEEIVPAPQPAELLERIQQIALKAHSLLGCSGISRTDMIYSNDTLHVLETNTLPGLTATSLLPKSYNAMGGTFTQLIDLLIEQALTRKPLIRI